MSEDKLTTLKEALKAAGLKDLTDEDLKRVVGACDTCKRECIVCKLGGIKTY
jgi:hypothetical protein